MSYLRGILVSVILLSIFHYTHAEETTELEKTFSLREAIEYGLEHSPQIRAARMGLKAVEEDVSISRSHLFPQIRIEERFLRTDNPAYVFSTKINQGRFTIQDLMGAPGTFNNPSPISNFQTTLSLEMPIYVRKAWIGLDISREVARTENLEFERTKEKVIFEIIKAYIGVRTANQAVKVAEQGLDNAEEHLRIAKARAGAGLGLQSDVLRAEVGVAEAKARLISAKKNLLNAKMALGLIIGLDGPANITDDIAIDINPLAEDYYVAQALQGKEMRAMELRYETAKKAVSLERSDYLPQLGIGAIYELDDPDAPFGSEGKSWQVMAFLRWDIFSGGRTFHSSKKAEYKLKEAGEYLEGLKKAIKYRVHEAYSELIEARAHLDLAISSLKSAEEGRRLIKIRYENNLAKMVDLLDAQTALDNARLLVVQKEGALYEAMVRLLFESNMMDNFLNSKGLRSQELNN